MVLELPGKLLGQSDVRETAVPDVSFYTPGYCNVTKTGVQAIPADTWTKITFDSEISDADDLHDNAVDNDRITVKEAGVYIITINITNTAGGLSTSNHQIRITKNATVLYETTLSAHNSPNTFCISLIQELAAGDFIFTEAYFDGNYNISAYARFSVVRIR